ERSAETVAPWAANGCGCIARGSSCQCPILLPAGWLPRNRVRTGRAARGDGGTPRWGTTRRSGQSTLFLSDRWRAWLTWGLHRSELGARAIPSSEWGDRDASKG